MELLERQTQLDQLAVLAARAADGQGQLGLITGEAGAGKSSLLTACAALLSEADWHQGGCDSLSIPRPFGPFLDMDSLSADVAGVATSSTNRERIFSSVLNWLDAGRLQVVAIEDLHWADEASLDLLLFLSRRIADLPVLILTTYRSDELAASPPLRVTLGELLTHQATTRIDLAPLSLNAIRALSTGAGVDPEEVFRITGGNPFFVSEALRSPGEALPATARDAILARVARLPQQAQFALGVAALIGSDVEPQILIEAASIELEMLDRILETGLLRTAGQSLRFSHELVREAVAAEVPPYRAPALHGAILAALESAGVRNDARLAFHAEEAGNWSTALRHAIAAAAAATEVDSHQEAAAQLNRALRVGQDEPGRVLAQRWYELAGHLFLLERLDEALQAASAAVQFAENTDDVALHGRTLLHLAMTAMRGGDGAAGDAALQKALGLLEPMGPGVELARAYVMSGIYRWFHGDPAQSHTYATRGLEMAQTLGDAEHTSDGLNVASWFVEAQGGDWVPLLTQSLQVAIEGSSWASAGWAYSNLLDGLVRGRRYAAAERYYADGLAVTLDHGQAVYASYLRGMRAIWLERTGDWDSVVDLVRQIQRSPYVAAQTQVIVMAPYSLILARRGDDQVQDALTKLRTAMRANPSPEDHLTVALVNAEAAWLRASEADARDAVESAQEHLDSGTEWTEAELCSWAKRLGTEMSMRRTTPEPYRLLLTGAAVEAADAFLALGCPYDAVLALYDAADEASLRRGLEICDELGATATASRVRQRMRELGYRAVSVGKRSATRANALGLTRREQDILDLLRTGKTNAQIAEALVISPKTVDHHVSAVLAKLRVPNRAAAVEAADRLTQIGES